MTKRDKLLQKIKDGIPISYSEAEALLKQLGFNVRSKCSHHVFYKIGHEKNISIKKRSELLPYQMRLLLEVVENHEE